MQGENLSLLTLLKARPTRQYTSPWAVSLNTILSRDTSPPVLARDLQEVLIQRQLRSMKAPRRKYCSHGATMPKHNDPKQWTIEARP